ncbi:MAG: hypothetical protein A2X79_06340 [Desulfuromonadaceae bacterium GWB2_53_15]|nr:MAG: hypothetical protein A2X83_03120 [Desulfuromonadales bacterium GWD2_54_10]OHB27750.1 MAG: hypothetical protein A2X79_06340 [Desulfuromonadaceae bacterium GWB2_53_15]
MKPIMAAILSLLVSATQVLAIGNTGNVEGLGLLASFFLVFGILALIFQFLPGLMLFGGMIKGLFPSTEKKN